MTRLAILADIHANLPALEAVIADMANFEIDHVIVAGDIVSGMPFSREVLERVLDLNWALIRGNHEFYLLHYQTPRYPAHWSHYTMPPYMAKELNGKWRNILAALPDTITLYYPDAPPVRVVHGSPRNNMEGMYQNTPEAKLAPMLEGLEEETLIFAHVHLRCDRHVLGKHLINPGSVGLPLDGNICANYALLDGDESGWRVTYRDVGYDVEKLLVDCERLNYENEVGLLATMLIEEVKTARPQIVPFYNWMKVHHPHVGFTEMTVDLFREFQAGGEFWEHVPEPYKVNIVKS